MVLKEDGRVRYVGKGTRGRRPKHEIELKDLELVAREVTAVRQMLEWGLTAAMSAADAREYRKTWVGRLALVVRMLEEFTDPVPQSAELLDHRRFGRRRTC